MHEAMGQAGFPAEEWRRDDGYAISTDPARIDRTVVARFLAGEAYWTPGLPPELLERALAHSLPAGIHAPADGMVGFGRVVTDYTAFAYLRDVFVLPAHRGRGLATWLATVIRSHPALATVGTWMLATRDAHGIYARAGFRPVPNPEFYMSLRRGEGGDRS